MSNFDDEFDYFRENAYLAYEKDLLHWQQWENELKKEQKPAKFEILSYEPKYSTIPFKGNFKTRLYTGNGVSSELNEAEF